MNDRVQVRRITVDEFFEALASNEDFIFAVAHTNSFKKNVKHCYKQNLDLNELYQVIVNLAKLEILPPKNRVHPLSGYGKERKGEKYMECHVAPDWLLIWVQKDNEMVLVFTNTGSHAKMFGM
ncbi:MAG: type II toxin-antitoxin system YafQ family toxin [Bacteroidales bacterium]|nr:type II toxin-antitoxin system YafQ family toxin [Bacteroidales bacterium]MCL2132930.1 type II toxin-antitoxin system YafQ family toxin [Bacteroidales bacterium]